MILNPNEANDNLDFVSETNFEPPIVKTWRTETPDEITLPIPDDKRGPDYIHEPEPAFEPELEYAALGPSRSPKLEELINMSSKKAKGPKTTKKGKKAKITTKRIEWDELQNGIEAILEDKPQSLNEGCTAIEPAESEPASAAPYPESAGHEQDVATKEPADDHAYLFSCCIKCKRLDWATIGEKYVPISLVPDGEEYNAAFLMVMCGSCSKLRATRNPQRFGFGGLDECTDIFRSMVLNKDLMEESKAYKAATIIAGKKVHVIGRIGELVYVEMNIVMKALTQADTMVSLDLDQVDSGNRSRIVFTHLKLGLI